MVAQIDREYLRITRSRTLVRLASYAFFEGRPPTTRGRFSNRFVFAQLNGANKHWRERPVEEPIFIVGIGRSGTTLLGRLLSTHRQVGFLNEPRAMWQVINPDHDVSDFYGESGRYLLTAEDATLEVKKTAHKIFSWYAISTRSKRIVDKYPEMVYRTAFVKAIFPDARIVAIAREPAATVKSICTWSKFNGTDEADWWGVRDAKWNRMRTELVSLNPDIEELLSHGGVQSDQDKAIVEWIVCMRAVVKSREAGALHSFLRYEDLVNEPDRVMSKILSDVDLPFDQRVLNYAKDVVNPIKTSIRHDSVDQFGHWAELVAETAQSLGYQL